MENLVDSFTNFTKEEITDFIKFGNNLANNPERIVFTKYCRNLINFLINNTKFNYLLSFLSDVNSHILSNFEENKVYLKEIINLNNNLLIMIKEDNLKQKRFDDLKSENLMINNYIIYLQNLNNFNYYEKLFIVGNDEIDRVYINLIVLKDTIKNHSAIALYA